MKLTVLNFFGPFRNNDPVLKFVGYAWRRKAVFETLAILSSTKKLMRYTSFANDITILLFVVAN